MPALAISALTFAIGHLPWLLGGTVLSAFADRLPRHRVLIATDAVGGVWTYTIELARALALQGVQPVVAAMGPRPIGLMTALGSAAGLVAAPVWGTLADRFAGGYCHVTTRANVQIREVAPQNALNVLDGILDLGLCSKGSGADNIIREATDLTSAVPAWLQADHDGLTAKVLRLPEREEIAAPVQEQLIVELYSK